MAGQLLNTLMNNHQTALRQLGNLDEQFDRYKMRVLADLKAIKDGKASLSDLTVSDQDYELKPPKPVIERNSHAKEPVEAKA